PRSSAIPKDSSAMSAWTSTAALDDDERVVIIDLPSFTSTVFIAAVFVVAGGVKGMAGLGLPTVAMGLLSLALPPSEAASLLLLPSLVTNVWQALAGPA